MNIVMNFLKKWRHAIVWTALYGFIIWGILQWLFNFDMFSAAHWSYVARARLHGFPGFVFGILVLAAIPLYVATTSLIVRTGNPLIEFKWLKKLSEYFTPVMDVDETENDTSSDEKDSENTSSDDDAPKKIMPSELAGPFAFARSRVSLLGKINEENNTASEHTDDNITTSDNESDIPMEPSPAPVSVQPVIQNEISSDIISNDIPLPTNFDISDTDFDTPTDNLDNMFTGFSAPTFTDISFDDAASALTPASESAGDKFNQFLNERGVKIVANENDVIITDKFAIAVHDDSDFWVVDNESWFAAGKQKTSPTNAITAAAATHGVRPVLYLAADNIMDLDKYRTQWESDGILIITAPEQLPLN